MIRFFDATAFVKAMIPQERGHDQAASLLGEPAGSRLAFATARIAALEALSKVWRLTRDRVELRKLEIHYDKFSFYELDLDYDLTRDLILKMGLKGADAGILAVAAGLSRRERVWVQFLSADQEQVRAARSLARHERIRAVSLPVGLK
jgi:predicted nucleic acid-binding protein